MIRKLFIAAALLLGSIALRAGDGTFCAGSLFSDHMVVQQDSYFPVWGWAESGTKISVSPSWTKNKFTTTATEDGEWMVAIPSPAAGGPYSMILSGSEPSVKGTQTIEISDILCGEVWICSGQSNMEISLRGFGFQYVEGAKDEVLGASAFADRIRSFKVSADTSAVLLEDVESSWRKASPEMAADCSALAWFFARRITEATGVPVGIIYNPWGGSKIEPWMSAEAVARALDGEDLERVMARRERAGGYPESVASCFNSRVYPIREYAARGFLWYQGCSNVGDHRYYDALMREMVAEWRSLWSDDDARMPFMFVTIAPNDYDSSDGISRPLLVESQLRALDQIPNSFAAISETYGQEHCIHPPFKKEIADQMAMYALSEIYGQPLGIPWRYPVPGEITYGQGSCEILFDGAWSSLGECTAREITGFELAGEDRVFHKAAAEMKDDGQTVRIECPEVPAPVAVRYSFRNYTPSNLRNTFGVPVPPFRTDDWD